MSETKTPSNVAATAAAKLSKDAVTPRGAQVLGDVVASYGATGEPVGSKTLVESGNYQLSGASLRNVMSELEDMGLLTHPHTSAGRIPTAAGYRYYAEHLVTAETPDAATQAALISQMAPRKGMMTVANDVSQALSAFTHCASLVTVPQHADDLLEHVDFIRMSDTRVLVVLMTKNGTLENRLIEVPAFITAEDLRNGAASLKPLLVGQTLDQARMALVSGLAEQKLQVNAMIDQMMTAAAQWGQPVTADGAMVVAGSTSLFAYPEIVRDKLQQLIKVFEEKRLLMGLVEEVRKGEGVRVFVGTDVPMVGADDMAVVGAAYGNPGRHILGTIGVIGPQRLNYAKTLGLVQFTQTHMNKLLADGTVTLQASNEMKG